VIHAETNKSDQYNGFAGWSYFWGKGIIAGPIRHEQHKVNIYSHLVTQSTELNPLGCIGVVCHRDVVLTESERAANTSIMVCCSGAKGPRIVLNL